MYDHTVQYQYVCNSWWDMWKPFCFIYSTFISKYCSINLQSLNIGHYLRNTLKATISQSHVTQTLCSLFHNKVKWIHFWMNLFLMNMAVVLPLVYLTRDIILVKKHCFFLYMENIISRVIGKPHNSTVEDFQSMALWMIPYAWIKVHYVHTGNF